MECSRITSFVERLLSPSGGHMVHLREVKLELLFEMWQVVCASCCYGYFLVSVSVRSCVEPLLETTCSLWFSQSQSQRHHQEMSYLWVFLCKRRVCGGPQVWLTTYITCVCHQVQQVFFTPTRQFVQTQINVDERRSVCVENTDSNSSSSTSLCGCMRENASVEVCSNLELKWK